jgi:F420-dependent oxidoreductase-like protein
MRRCSEIAAEVSSFASRRLGSFTAMQTAIGVGGAASGGKRDFDRTVAFAVEAEKLGVDQAWSAEAWGLDAVSTLAYLAALTERLTLGTGILQISARTPSMTAMTAMSLASISGDRFVLGLGASGPQVVEGLQGQSFRKPLTRMREVIEILRMAFRGEKLAHVGEHYVLPRPGGEGKALRLAQPPNPGIPIYLATLSPRGLELTGELADGWLGTSFTPEHAEAHLEHLRRGAEKAGRSLADLALCVGGSVAITDDPEPLIRAAKPRLAFTLGAMGSAKTNFYNDAYRRGGFEDVAVEVQRLWLEGRREEAARAVPDALVERTNLLGPEDHVRDRIRKYRDAGVSVLRLAPAGETDAQRLDTLGRAVELVREESAG